MATLTLKPDEPLKNDILNFIYSIYWRVGTALARSLG